MPFDAHLSLGDAKPLAGVVTRLPRPAFTGSHLDQSQTGYPPRSQSAQAASISAMKVRS